MSKFFASEETTQFDLEDGFWVELKNELDYGEESELEGAAIRSGIDPNGRPRMEYSLKQMRALKLALYIVDWNLVGETGKPVNLPGSTAQRQIVVNRLRPVWAKKISDEIDRIRIANKAVEGINLSNVEDAEENPTKPGDEFESDEPSPSPNGGAAVTAISSRPRTKSSGKRSR